MDDDRADPVPPPTLPPPEVEAVPPPDRRPVTGALSCPPCMDHPHLRKGDWSGTKAITQTNTGLCYTPGATQMFPDWRRLPPMSPYVSCEYVLGLKVLGQGS